jgi:glycosyltransferase involved in cell wall biosynthesis
MKVLLIIPAFNEEESLAKLLAELEQYRKQYDIIVVDDASVDKTAEIAESHGVPVLHLAANLGIGGAVQTGFKYAVRNGYDAVVQIDGDGQHDPIWIERLIEPISRGEADCVIGSRYTKKDPDRAYRTPTLRRIGMHFSTGLLYFAKGVLITDTTSGLRALNHRAFEYFSRDYPVDHPEAEALLMLLYNDFKLKEIPVKMRGRQTGRSLFTLIPSVFYPFRVLVGFLEVLLRIKRK